MIDCDVTQEGAAIKIGDRLVVDFGAGNTEMAWRFAQDIQQYSSLRIRLDGEAL